MGMDQNFYVVKKKDMAPFMKNMRMLFKNDPDNLGTYSEIVSSIPMEEIGYARKNFLLHEIITSTVEQASNENGGWTYITEEDLQKVIKALADRTTFGDYDAGQTLIILGGVVKNYWDSFDDEEEPFERAVLYSADW